VGENGSVNEREQEGGGEHERREKHRAD